MKTRSGTLRTTALSAACCKASRTASALASASCEKDWAATRLLNEVIDYCCYASPAWHLVAFTHPRHLSQLDGYTTQDPQQNRGLKRGKGHKGPRTRSEKGYKGRHTTVQPIRGEPVGCSSNDSRSQEALYGKSNGPEGPSTSTF